MAEPPQYEQAATIMNTTEQTPTGGTLPANDSVVEISDDSTNKSVAGTSRAPSSSIEIVEDGSNKRKAADHEQTTPAKKQKPSPREVPEKKAGGDAQRKGDGESGSMTTAEKNTKDLQQEAVDVSQAGSQKLTPQYASIEDCRKRANIVLNEKRYEIRGLKIRIENIEEVRDKWQAKAARSELKAKEAEDNQEAYGKKMFKKAQDWKKQELQNQVEDLKQKHEKDLEKAKTSWQKKLDKEQDRVEGLRAEKEKLKDIKKELEDQIKTAKPGDSKLLKEKAKELETSQNKLTAQKTNNEVLQGILEQRNDDFDRMTADRDDCKRKSRYFHTEWTQQVKLNDKLKMAHAQLINELKAEHADDLQQQYQMWNVQAKNSHQNQLRLVGRQRGLFDLNNAHDRVIEEKDQYKKELKAARAEIERLKTSAAPQPPRPVPAARTPTNDVRVQISRLQEPQTQASTSKVDNSAESSRALATPQEETTSQHKAAENPAKPNVDATVDSDRRQVTQIVNESMAAAQQPRGEPHSAALAPFPAVAGAEDIAMDGVTREAGGSAAGVLSRDMHAAREDNGDHGEGEAFAGTADGQLQDMQGVGGNGGDFEEDESFGEATDGQLQIVQAAQENPGRAEEDEAFVEATQDQMQDVQTAHDDPVRTEEGGGSVAAEQAERESPGAGGRRGLFSFNNFWRSDGGSSA
ncbi:hypothetical protein CLAFUW4_09769 [Fulvia fulva]|uniref:Uncharacterized protein n=1 Tax=Passalora fulva TaxID=5499 RepID=A0A9Q8PHS1_PASFU|nr:uncharacterized protein CLAFUR5_12468 [Fulvia fulva]KAK4615602.1 hypothetical protein CLAFUR4_09774 [Fulvia fulva]KAK4616963.1 hypothetical protein CLAFUR0_09767 [Fulvia fulva]UJO22708.1 hypothetical protein CLAFUR5_12468 [Fulvia fulva]WPV19682.1 hypothetical protein CLAFUW4_09769 [Fulvia fulva]WPV34171.1 hypothetical protein CLAFUW7_09772 [Fulvia fulva]